jgi:hypothetical protein
MQFGDLSHPHHGYATAGGKPGVSDHTSGATVDYHTTTEHRASHRATNGLPRGMTTCPIGPHRTRRNAAMGQAQ